MPDVEVQNHGSIFLFVPHSAEAREWIAENVSDESTWFGGGLVVEGRYAHDLADGMLADGLNVN